MLSLMSEFNRLLKCAILTRASNNVCTFFKRIPVLYEELLIKMKYIYIYIVLYIELLKNMVCIVILTQI